MRYRLKRKRIGSGEFIIKEVEEADIAEDYGADDKLIDGKLVEVYWVELASEGEGSLSCIYATREDAEASAQQHYMKTLICNMEL